MTKNKKLLDWVQQTAAWCTPERIHWCDGSQQEYNQLCDLMVKTGTFTKLNEANRPNSYYCRSDPADVARPTVCAVASSRAKRSATSGFAAGSDES